MEHVPQEEEGEDQVGDPAFHLPDVELPGAEGAEEESQKNIGERPLGTVKLLLFLHGAEELRHVLGLVVVLDRMGFPAIGANIAIEAGNLPMAVFA